MPNPVPPVDIYQTDPNWPPDPSPDRSRECVQEVFYAEDPDFYNNGELLRFFKWKTKRLVSKGKLEKLR